MSIFSKIISGELPAFKIKEDENFLAFLDISPLKEGHVLVVPKKEVDKVFDLDDEILSQYFLFAKPIAKAIEQAFDCKRCGVAFIGLEVPHAHMHLVPISNISDMDFSKPKLQPSKDELAAAQEKILKFL